jgi:hypothetical protein
MPGPSALNAFLSRGDVLAAATGSNGTFGVDLG